VVVSSHNLGTDALDWLQRIDGDAVAEIHLAGHHADPVLGDGLWIDSHDSAVCDTTWRLYALLLHRIGPRPTLIERDDALPPYAELQAEARWARALYAEACAEVAHG
jgi:uncharacterized protein (UPF0276 family)